MPVFTVGKHFETYTDGVYRSKLALIPTSLGELIVYEQRLGGAALKDRHDSSYTVIRGIHKQDLPRKENGRRIMEFDYLDDLNLTIEQRKEICRTVESMGYILPIKGKDTEGRHFKI